MTVFGYVSLVAWSIVHTNAGRAPFDLSGFGRHPRPRWGREPAGRGRHPDRSRSLRPAHDAAVTRRRYIDFVSGTIPVDIPGSKQLGASLAKAPSRDCAGRGADDSDPPRDLVRSTPATKSPAPSPGLAAGVSLFWIRRNPFAAFLTNGFAVYALIGLGYPSDFYQWTNLVALFAAAARVETRQAIAALALGWIGVILYFLRFPEEGGLILAGAVLAIWTAGWFAGRAQFARVREAEVIRERDISRAELAAQQARAQLEAERSRIARDLHDIIGHAVNVMVVHAGAGQVNAPNPPARARPRSRPSRPPVGRLCRISIGCSTSFKGFPSEARCRAFFNSPISARHRRVRR